MIQKDGEAEENKSGRNKIYFRIIQENKKYM